MRYKAKASYKTMKDNKFAILAPQKHIALMSGGWVEFEPSKELIEHLQPEKSNKVKEEKNGD